jgi:hypothetical protein
MIAIPKIVGVMSCGVLLCLGLLGNAESAPAGMEAGQSGERVGGQAGREYEHGHGSKARPNPVNEWADKPGGNMSTEHGGKARPNPVNEWVDKPGENTFTQNRSTPLPHNLPIRRGQIRSQ